MTGPREPFDQEEAALAKVYRALPGGEPSASVDAAVLQIARAAAPGAVSAGAKRRRRPWFTGVGFGTAAVAVMAAGLAWQFGWRDGLAPTRDSRLEPPPAAPAASLEEERIDIEFLRQERAPASPVAAPRTSPPPVAPAQERARATAPPPQADARHDTGAAPPGNTRETTAPVSAEPSPAAAAPPSRERPASAKAAAPALSNRDASGPAADASPSAEEVSAPEPTAAAPPPAPLGLSGASQAAPRRQGAGLPAWSEDARLPPEAWLERIRERVTRADRSGAQNSLRRFVLMHPDRPVPRDLQRLLVE